MSNLYIITGGIGAGKSTVLARFAALGAQVLDADDVAHALYAPGTGVLAEISRHFGASLLSADGALNRAALASRVFGDPAALAWLNGLIHPLVRERIVSEAARIAPALLFAAVPLWYECGWCDSSIPVIAVWCDTLTQHARLAARGWNDAEIARRLASQLPMDEKLNRADYGILTNCSWARLNAQCTALYTELTTKNATSNHG